MPSPPAVARRPPAVNDPSVAKKPLVAGVIAVMVAGVGPVERLTGDMGPIAVSWERATEGEVGTPGTAGSRNLGTSVLRAFVPGTSCAVINGRRRSKIRRWTTSPMSTVVSIASG